MDIKKIIAAIDFGPDTGKTLVYTEWLAGMTGARGAVTLLHVMDYTLTPPAYLLPYIEEEERQNRDRLDLIAVRLREKGITVEYDVVLGRLVEAFDTYLREEHIDVLVLGHKSHLFRLSSSERLTRSLQHPMLVVRGAKSEGAVAGPVKIKKILCPVDFSAGSAKTLEWAGHLAQKNKSELIVLHALSDPYLQLSMRKGCDEKNQEKYLNETMADAGERLAGLVQGMDGVKRMVTHGDPCTTISEAGRDMDIDLVVMGARGAYLLSGLLLGSVSESVLRSSSCPVFIVH
jgi:nucleotide-binding universal stress UspA family protein